MGQAALQIEEGPADVQDFLDAYDGVPGRHEYVDGRVLSMMTGNTHLHQRVAYRLAAALLPVEGRLAVMPEGGVRTANGIRYPDILVCAPLVDPAARFTTEPLIAIEVLSPSTAEQDFGDKRHEYLGCASLRHYLIVSQAVPEAWLWSRDSGGEWPRSAMVLGEADTIELGAIDLSFPLAAIY